MSENEDSITVKTFTKEKIKEEIVNQISDYSDELGSLVELFEGYSENNELIETLINELEQLRDTLDEIKSVEDPEAIKTPLSGLQDSIRNSKSYIRKYKKKRKIVKFLDSKKFTKQINNIYKNFRSSSRDLLEYQKVLLKKKADTLLRDNGEAQKALENFENRIQNLNQEKTFSKSSLQENYQLNKQATQHLYDIIDISRDGEIQEGEFQDTQQIIQTGGPAALTKWVFHSWDRNKNLKVTVDEITKSMFSVLYVYFFIELGKNYLTNRSLKNDYFNWEKNSPETQEKFDKKILELIETKKSEINLKTEINGLYRISKNNEITIENLQIYSKDHPELLIYYVDFISIIFGWSLPTWLSTLAIKHGVKNQEIARTTNTKEPKPSKSFSIPQIFEIKNLQDTDTVKSHMLEGFKFSNCLFSFGLTGHKKFHPTLLCQNIKKALPLEIRLEVLIIKQTAENTNKQKSTKDKNNLESEKMDSIQNKKSKTGIDDDKDKEEKEKEEEKEEEKEKEKEKEDEKEEEKEKEKEKEKKDDVSGEEEEEIVIEIDDVIGNEENILSDQEDKNQQDKEINLVSQNIYHLFTRSNNICDIPLELNISELSSTDKLQINLKISKCLPVKQLTDNQWVCYFSNNFNNFPVIGTEVFVCDGQQWKVLLVHEKENENSNNDKSFLYAVLTFQPKLTSKKNNHKQLKNQYTFVVTDGNKRRTSINTNISYSNRNSIVKKKLFLWKDVKNMSMIKLNIGLLPHLTVKKLTEMNCYSIIVPQLFYIFDEIQTEEFDFEYESMVIKFKKKSSQSNQVYVYLERKPHLWHDLNERIISFQWSVHYHTSRTRITLNANSNNSIETDPIILSLLPDYEFEFNFSFEQHITVKQYIQSQENWILSSPRFPLNIFRMKSDSIIALGQVWNFTLYCKDRVWLGMKIKGKINKNFNKKVKFVIEIDGIVKIFTQEITYFKPSLICKKFTKLVQLRKKFLSVQITDESNNSVQNTEGETKKKMGNFRSLLLHKIIKIDEKDLTNSDNKQSKNENNIENDNNNHFNDRDSDEDDDDDDDELLIDYDDLNNSDDNIDINIDNDNDNDNENQNQNHIHNLKEMKSNISINEKILNPKHQWTITPTLLCENDGCGFINAPFCIPHGHYQISFRAQKLGCDLCKQSISDFFKKKCKKCNHASHYIVNWVKIKLSVIEIMVNHFPTYRNRINTCILSCQNCQKSIYPIGDQTICHFDHIQRQKELGLNDYAKDSISGYLYKISDYIKFLGKCNNGESEHEIYLKQIVISREVLYNMKYAMLTYLYGFDQNASTYGMILSNRRSSVHYNGLTEGYILSNNVFTKGVHSFEFHPTCVAIGIIKVDENNNDENDNVKDNDDDDDDDDDDEQSANKEEKKSLSYNQYICVFNNQTTSYFEDEKIKIQNFQEGTKDSDLITMSIDMKNHKVMYAINQNDPSIITPFIPHKIRIIVYLNFENNNFKFIPHNY
ncbi:origin recognition complex subunit [Anaeramoeba flamelloides]|uniref:Origin recognition complex subunit n=1 Tax=Anaeramoeba flamelloides TaxID=1746091 RepID=A0AAV7YIV8_9EUKA|nr:origin recognition complex subunit [Anaeramoeba flamelloides]